jgi:hypothetical protein
LEQSGRVRLRNFFEISAFLFYEVVEMKTLFRALVLAAGVIVALGIIKWLFFKIFFFALWVAILGAIAYVAYRVIKTA